MAKRKTKKKTTKSKKKRSSFERFLDSDVTYAEYLKAERGLTELDFSSLSPVVEPTCDPSMSKIIAVKSPDFSFAEGIFHPIVSPVVPLEIIPYPIYQGETMWDYVDIFLGFLEMAFEGLMCLALVCVMVMIIKACVTILTVGHL
jgi:hypothetical protein